MAEIASPPDDERLTREAAAVAAGVSVGTIDTLADEGVIERLPQGRRGVRFWRSQCEAYKRGELTRAGVREKVGA